MVVSGCLIVKDEEGCIVECLAALGPFVDEIVVYDTGSGDRTRQLAASCGARVVEGFWDDDFAAARNRARAECAGEWILSVDADEVLDGDPRALRTELARTQATVLAVETVLDVRGGTGRSTVWLTRLFRAELCTWEGALHEQVIATRGDLVGDLCRSFRLYHSGYLPARLADGTKAQRNLRIAERELAGYDGRDDARRAKLTLNLGRSLSLAGRHREALDVLEGVTALHPDLALLVSAARSAVVSAIELGELAVARAWADRLRDGGETPSACRAMEADIARAAGRFDLVVDLLEGLGDEVVDHAGVAVDTTLHGDWLADAHYRSGRLERCAEILSTRVLARCCHTRPTVVVTRLAEVPGALGALVVRMPAQDVGEMASQLAAEGTGLDLFLGALWDAGRSRATVLEHLLRTTLCLSPEGLLAWIDRLGEAGSPALLRIALHDRDVETLTRLVAAAWLVEAGDPEALPTLDRLLSLVPDEEEERVRHVIARAAPGVAAALVPL